MIMFKKYLTKLFTSSRGSVGEEAVDLPPLDAPKPPSGGTQVVLPFLGTSKGSTIPDSLTNTTNLVLSDHIRNEASLAQTVQKIARTSPDVSAAIDTKIRTTLTNKFKAVAYTPAGRIDEAGTELIHQFLTRLNYGSYDYSRYTNTTDLRSVGASCLLDNLRYGRMGVELVLGKTKLPAFLKPIPIRLVKYVDDTPGYYPVYSSSQGDVPLNYPTIFISNSSLDSEFSYPDSPLQAVVQMCLWDADFIDTLRRAAVKNLLQRLVVTINTDAYLKTLPMEVQTDNDKLESHMNATVSALESQLAGLSPEDALVLFDSLEADTISDANRSEDRTIDVLNGLMSGKIASGSKVLPSVIGRGSSSSAASTEALLFIKAISSLQTELNVMFSRAFTFAARLMGLDVYVKFEYEEVNLRPELELTSFRAIHQSTVLSQLSLGMVSDLEACVDLTGHLPPDGYVNKSGTMFSVSSANTGSGNDYSNTSVSSSGKPDSTQSQKDSEADQTGVKS